MSSAYRQAFHRPWVRIAVPLAALVVLGACSSSPNDESTNWTPEKLYAEAQDDMKSGNNERASRLLERLEGRAAGTLLGQQAQLDRAFILYRSNDRAQALSVLDRFIRLHPTSPAFDYALYLQGLANFNDNLGIFSGLSRQDLSERDQQASRESYQSFRRVAEQFPTSRYAEDSKVRMNYIINSLAAYELHVARYYFRRGAYVAAASRAQQAVQEFQQSPATEEGLFLMAQSYERLGLTQLRDDALRVLAQNFPSSTLIRDGGRLTEKPWWQFW
jgi:outer membrane protein assembly factor BamD